jgi:hypothetical protein
MKLEQAPHIFQYNKRDVPQPLPIGDLNLKLNPFGAPVFETVATTGVGVFDALKSITALVLNDLRRRGVWDGGVSASPPGRELSAPFGVVTSDRGDTSIAQKIQALSEAADAVERLEPNHANDSPPSRSPTAPMFSVGAPRTNTSLSVPPPPALAPSHGSMTNSAAGGAVVSAMSTGNSGLARLPINPRIGPPGQALAELLPEGPAREKVASAEAELARGDFAAAVRITARAFAESARTESTSTEIAPVLHALMLRLDGRRYLRFCEAAQRAESGSASSQDALFAVFFLVDSYLER